MLSARSAESKISDEEQTEVTDDKKLDQIQPENAFAYTSEKSAKNTIKESAMKKIRSLVKSGSCPNTPIKGTSTSDVLKIEEQVGLDVTVELRRHSELRLPFHMERLFELFRACETLVSIIHNRSEVCSFDKIKPAVQEVVRW